MARSCQTPVHSHETLRFADGACCVHYTISPFFLATLFCPENGIPVLLMPESSFQPKREALLLLQFAAASVIMGLQSLESVRKLQNTVCYAQKWCFRRQKAWKGGSISCVFSLNPLISGQKSSISPVFKQTLGLSAAALEAPAKNNLHGGSLCLK